MPVLQSKTRRTRMINHHKEACNEEVRSTPHTVSIMATAPRLRSIPETATSTSTGKATPPPETESKPSKTCWCSPVVWLLLALVVLVVVAGALLPVRYHHWHDDDNDDNPYLGANLVLQDSQRLVLGSLLVIPEPGDQDIILVVVNNVDDHDVANIAVTLEVTSAARKRAPLALPLVCPPLYVDNVVPYLATKTSTTCRAVYLLTSGDIVNGNVIYTQSMATGTIVTTTMETVAKPGMSQLALNNLEMPKGAILGIPGPSAGPMSVVTGSCNISFVPVTPLECMATNALQILVCDPNSSPQLVGSLYMCTGVTWTFFGTVDMMGNHTGPTGPTGPTGGTGPAGPQGVGIYGAYCTGGPPPTTVSFPTYTCNAAFALNMILCSLGSLNGNAGVIYQCRCSPSCAWTEVASLQAVLTWINGQSCNGNPWPAVPNVWTNVVSAILPAAGTYQCTFESTFNYANTFEPCPIFYGITTITESAFFLDNSMRQMDVAFSNTYAVDTTVASTAQVVVSSPPTTVYVTVGINTVGTTGCGIWHETSCSNLRCLKTA